MVGAVFTSCHLASSVDGRDRVELAGRWQVAMKWLFARGVGAPNKGTVPTEGPAQPRDVCAEAPPSQIPSRPAALWGQTHVAGGAGGTSVTPRFHVPVCPLRVAVDGWSLEMPGRQKAVYGHISVGGRGERGWLRESQCAFCTKGFLSSCSAGHTG